MQALPDDELLAGVADVYRAEARVAALKARYVAELDSRQAYAAVGAQTATAWIRHRCRVPEGAARHDVALARSLRHRPSTEAALADGDIGAAQAAAIARHHRNPRTEAAVERDDAFLATEAGRLPWRSFTTVLAYWAQHADPDGTDDAAEARKARRHLHLSRTFEGEWIVNGLLDPVAGATVDAALRRIEDTMFAADRDEAGTSLLLKRTPAQRRADALVELARRASSAPPGARKPAPLVTVLVGYESFAGRICELADGTVLAPGDVAALLDRAVIERAVFDGPARVMEIGEQRFFTGALRRAIQLRDRTCTHEWCDRPADQCDVDHKLPWEWGGRTAAHNGRIYCPFHNHLRQRRGPPSLNEVCDMQIVRDELADDPTVDITTTGRHTRLPRRIEIWMLDVDGRFFITGTPGRRDWLANLDADPRLTVHLTRRAGIDLDATASRVSDPVTRREVLEHLSARWYRSQTPLDDLVATAPMVEVTF